MEMKKILKYLPIFSVAAASAQAATQTAEAPQTKINDILRLGQESYIVVFKFDSFPQYEEFQRNANIMRTSYSTIEKLSEALKAETDENAKKNLSAKIDQLQNEFKINDQTMREGYNFSSVRQYKVMFTKSNICVPVSDEELSIYQFKDGTKINPLSVVKSENGKHFSRKSSITGVKENEELQIALHRTLSYRIELKKLREELAKTTKTDEINAISEKIANYEKSLKISESVLNEKYGIESGKQYLLEIEKSDLLMLLSPEEVLKIQAQKNIKK